MSAAPAFSPDRPPNAGAQALAAWLEADDARWARLPRAAGVGAGSIDRMLSGELEPTDEIAAQIAEATAGAVAAEAWTRAAAGGWQGEVR